MMLFNKACLAALAVLVASLVDASTPTGHRYIRDASDMDKYVMGERLPTMFLIHSSNEEECSEVASCEDVSFGI